MAFGIDCAAGTAVQQVRIRRGVHRLTVNNAEIIQGDIGGSILRHFKVGIVDNKCAAGQINRRIRDGSHNRAALERINGQHGQRSADSVYRNIIEYLQGPGSGRQRKCFVPGDDGNVNDRGLVGQIQRVAQIHLPALAAMYGSSAVDIAVIKSNVAIDQRHIANRTVGRRIGQQFICADGIAVLVAGENQRHISSEIALVIRHDGAYVRGVHRHAVGPQTVILGHPAVIFQLVGQIKSGNSAGLVVPHNIARTGWSKGTEVIPGCVIRTDNIVIVGRNSSSHGDNIPADLVQGADNIVIGKNIILQIGADAAGQIYRPAFSIIRVSVNVVIGHGIAIHNQCSAALIHGIAACVNHCPPACGYYLIAGNRGGVNIHCTGI